MLEEKLHDRPSPSALLENHILQGNLFSLPLAPVSLAPALHASSIKIEHALEHRPKKEELVTANLLKSIVCFKSNV